ncbi:MAG: 5'-3' exonuclease H3TH domain-containing protein [Candidatus Dasytiphilus stammeri]
MNIKFNKLDSFFLIDGSYYFYKAYYALPTLTNSKGEPTGAIYGVLNMLDNFLQSYNPKYMLVVFDAPEKNFRHKLFTQYKSNRRSMPYSLQLQIKPLYNIIKAMGIPILVASGGVEADDIIGTLATEYIACQGGRVYIDSNDKDIAQLVTSNIFIINTSDNTLVGPSEVLQKYGVPPNLIIDLIALMGDYSDNIPGIPGVGIKTAQRLLTYIGNVKQIFSNLSKVAELSFPGVKNLTFKLEQYKEMVFLYRILATIKTDLPIKINYDKLIVNQPNMEEFIKLCKHYEFKNWMHKIQKNLCN